MRGKNKESKRERKKEREASERQMRARKSR